MLAGELALGLLDDAEQAAARARMLADPAFAAEVAYWQAWLMPLAVACPDEAPPPALEAKVMAAIAAPVPGKARGWRALAFAAVALAAAMVALVVGPFHLPAPVPVPVNAPPHPALLAALAVPAGQEAEGRSALAAAVEPGTGVVRVSPVGGVPVQRTAELWAIAEGRAPVSLGLLAATGESRVTVPAAARGLLRSGVTLAVSVEPAGGSPTGTPTGPVVAAGVIAAG